MRARRMGGTFGMTVGSAICPPWGGSGAPPLQKENCPNARARVDLQTIGQTMLRKVLPRRGEHENRGTHLIGTPGIAQTKYENIGARVTWCAEVLGTRDFLTWDCCVPQRKRLGGTFFSRKLCTKTTALAIKIVSLERNS